MAAGVAVLGEILRTPRARPDDLVQVLGPQVSRRGPGRGEGLSEDRDGVLSQALRELPLEVAQDRRRDSAPSSATGGDGDECAPGKAGAGGGGEEPFVDELGHGAVHGLPGHPGTPGELGDGHLVGALVEVREDGHVGRGDGFGTALGEAGQQGVGEPAAGPVQQGDQRELNRIVLGHVSPFAGREHTVSVKLTLEVGMGAEDVVGGGDPAVLVVGAGPVGLTAALQLARCGVPVRVIDEKPGPATTSRALATHARTLEIYDQMGVLADIAPHGTRINAFVRHLTTHVVRVDFDFGDLRTRFPYVFNIDQVITERVLRGHAAAAGVQVEWGTGLVSFTQDEQGVTAVLRHGGHEDETVRVHYLWGCDGGHSTVRKSLGLPLEGEAAHTWMIADARVETSLDRDGLHWLFPPGGALMLFPFPDPHKWRLLDTSGEGDPQRPEEIAAQFRAKLSAALGRDTPVTAPSWVSTFTIQQRAVPVMHVSRCFVSGDAAHVHSPASGQGMNTGIHDAYNLAWKLAMVLRGDAAPSLLETYDVERVPVGQALLASTGEVMATAMSDAGENDTARSDYAFMRRLIRGMSGLSIAYPDSPLTVDNPSGGAPEQVSPGERLTQVGAEDAQAAGWIRLRAALRECRWNLLAPAGPVLGAVGQHDLTPLPSWLRPVALDDTTNPGGIVRRTLGLADDGWILVRPDGYVAARGSARASLHDAVDRLQALAGLHVRPPAGTSARG